MPIILDGYTFPDNEQPYHGPLKLLDEQKWTSAPVLGSASIGTILTFESLRSQKIPMVVRASTATRDKLLAVYIAQKEVLLQTNEDTTGFSVLLTDLKIEHEMPLPNNLYLCEFALRSRRAKTGTPTDIGESPSPDPDPDPGPGPGPEDEVIIIKGAHQILNNSSNFQNDDELFFPVAAGEYWIGDIYLYLTLKAASDFKFYLEAQDLASFFAIGWASGLPQAGGTTQNVVTGKVGQIDVLVSSNALVGVKFHFILYCLISGTARLVWAQKTAVAEDTQVNETSHIIAVKQ